MSDVHEALVAQAELLDHLLTPDPSPPRRWPFYVLALVLLLGAVGAAAALRLGRDAGGPPHPAAWDARVQKYVDFVEKRRDLTFEHPVYVDFLPEADFEEQVPADRGDPGDDLTDLEGRAGVFSALGLLAGDADSADSYTELLRQGATGSYSYEDERLRIRGTEITPAVESTIVHELTHALQDQHFDLGQRFAELDRADDAHGSATTGGLLALVEGDARRVETMWRGHLADADRAALDRDQRAVTKALARGSQGVPEVLRTLVAAPHDLSQTLLTVAVRQGGQGAVDDLFRSPPRTEEQQLDPWALVADHQGYLSVPGPDLPEGAQVTGEGAFGALGWLVLLSARIPAEQALTAVDGWGGDALAAYDSAGTGCVVIDYRADTPEDLAQMQSALQAWVAKGPAGSAGVTRQAQTLVLQSCDPGQQAVEPARGRSTDAVDLALTRTRLSLVLVKGGLDVATARCGADRLVRVLSAAELERVRLDQKRVLQTISPCRQDA